MGILRILRDIAVNKKKIVTRENEIMADVVNVKTAFDFAAFYAKYKTIIWASLWSLGTYIAAPVINDAVNGLPVLQDTKARITVVEQEITKIHSDLNDIKKVLTPPSQ